MSEPTTVARGRVEQLAHDLCAPLTVIRGACFDLERNERDPTRLRRLRLIDEEVDRLAEGLAALQRPAMPAATPAATRSVSVARLVGLAVRRHAVAARRSGVVVVGRVEQPATVGGEPRALARALDNIVSNAVRHARRRVVISVSCRGAQRVEIRVADDGAGVADVDRERIFEPGVRGRRTVGAGRGLGLYGAREVAREHGGALRLLPSESGACFCLELPLASASPSELGAA